MYAIPNLNCRRILKMKNINKFVPRILATLIVMIVLSMIITSTVLAANYNGTWVNNNQSTRGMVKFTIEPGTFQGYGQCQPTPCDWKTTPLILYSKSISDSNDIAGIAEYNFGFSKDIITLKMISPTLIEANHYTQFTDGSGRHNFVETGMFKRQ